MKHKEHLQDLLVTKGFADSREQAERMILAACVKVNGEVKTHAGALISSDAEIEVSGGNKYVSRGGLKLEGALEDFSYNPDGLFCIDVGASSGGFTDCLLQQGASAVVAVDVGYGQFDWKLRKDSRVTLFERTNITKADPTELKAPFDLLVIDVSFTSLVRLAGVCAGLIKERGDIISLVKPQFELPKDLVKNGVVRSFDLHVKALMSVMEAYSKVGLSIQGASFSPLLGAKGNTEFWIWATKQAATATIDQEEVMCLAQKVVRQAHTELLETL